MKGSELEQADGGVRETSLGCGLLREPTLTSPRGYWVRLSVSQLGAPMAGLSPDLMTNSGELSLGPPCLVGLELFPHGPPTFPVPQFLPGIAFPCLPLAAVPFVTGPSCTLTRLLPFAHAAQWPRPSPPPRLLHDGTD